MFSPLACLIIALMSIPRASNLSITLVYLVTSNLASFIMFTLPDLGWGFGGTHLVAWFTYLGLPYWAFFPCPLSCFDLLLMACSKTPFNDPCDCKIHAKSVDAIYACNFQKQDQDGQFSQKKWKKFNTFVRKRLLVRKLIPFLFILFEFRLMRSSINEGFRFCRSSIIETWFTMGGFTKIDLTWNLALVLEYPIPYLLLPLLWLQSIFPSFTELISNPTLIVNVLSRC